MKRFVLLLILIGAACAPANPTAAPTTPPVDTSLLAPDFTATALGGETVTLSTLRGRWVLLNFWATWCAPCAAEMPALQQIADRYRDNLIVLGINLREDAGVVEPFVAEHGLRFPVLINPDDATVLNYQVVGLPQTLLIAPSGEIVYRQFGPVDLESFSGEIEGYIRL